ncbi:MAG: hypothetical protein ABSH28_04740 [Acidobacteriota bacterium]
MRNTTLATAAVLLLTFTIAHCPSGDAQVRLVSSDQHLKSIEKSIEAARQAVAKIDIESLNVSYEEGKLIERWIKLVQSRVDMATSRIASLRRKETLLGEFNLAVTLEGFNAAMEGLESAVMHRSVQTAQAVLNAREPLLDGLTKYEDFVSTNMRSADSILEGRGAR